MNKNPHRKLWGISMSFRAQRGISNKIPHYVRDDKPPVISPLLRIPATAPALLYLPPSVAVPVTVSGITTATAIAAGFYHTCAALSNGTVQCWGNNGLGQLGNGTTTGSFVPVPVSGL